jgi:hypothetical protein
MVPPYPKAADSAPHKASVEVLALRGPSGSRPPPSPTRYPKLLAESYQRPASPEHRTMTSRPTGRRVAPPSFELTSEGLDAILFVFSQGETPEAAVPLACRIAGGPQHARRGALRPTVEQETPSGPRALRELCPGDVVGETALVASFPSRPWWWRDDTRREHRTLIFAPDRLRAGSPLEGRAFGHGHPISSQAKMEADQRRPK